MLVTITTTLEVDEADFARRQEKGYVAGSMNVAEEVALETRYSESQAWWNRPTTETTYTLLDSVISCENVKITVEPR